ncbi:unnamed protein product [Adineta steineri]|uniref:G-protein coupled receptors family 1 profile domain-containing protein n=1 Tax=Adineta steineri TaxID=433720 RepID=A0A818XSH9_9BILA|nr:unnamed protein product [Adineta steineri]CAF0953940.1 unnamed protein product [Adineta steineri]CAF3649940.1 unnamed protein product [Adineta steineri]CAF3744507.1 unnamed protein product [Adineta steineri]
MIQTELPMTIGFLIKNRAIIQTKSFCIYWNYWFYVWSTMSIQFSMLTSINRYLFIFHKVFLLKYKLYCHYLPILCFWLYLPCLYLYFIIFFPYGNTTFDFSKEWCGGPHFLLIRVYVTWDTVFNTFIPAAITVLFNLIIIAKVIFFKKLSANTVTKWKKNRRMILQLIGICSSQLIGSVPYSIVTLGEVYGSRIFALNIYEQALVYTFYIPSLFSPLFAMVTLPKDIRDKVPLISRCWKKKPSTVSVLRRMSVVDADPSTRDHHQIENRNESSKNRFVFSKIRSCRTAPEPFLETHT